MTDTANARESAWAALETAIKTVSGIEIVRRHEPRVIASNQFVGVSYMGDEKIATTIGGNVMVWARFRVRCYWSTQGLDPGALDVIEKQIWDTDRAIQAAIRADSTLGGNVTDLDIDDSSQTTYLELADQVMFRVLTINVDLAEFEAESIAP